MTKRGPSEIIGLDIGGTKCAVGVYRRDRVVRELHRFPTGRPAETLAEFARAVAAHGLRLLEPGS